MLDLEGKVIIQELLSVEEDHALAEAIKAKCVTGDFEYDHFTADKLLLAATGPETAAAYNAIYREYA